jgi:hypothetical protein
LTECDRWDFGFYQRTPLITSTGVVFYPATNSAGALDLKFASSSASPGNAPVWSLLRSSYRERTGSPDCLAQ